MYVDACNRAERNDLSNDLHNIAIGAQGDSKSIKKALDALK